MLAAQLQKNLQYGIAAAIRLTTTFNPRASIEEMVAAGDEVGLNRSTVRIQFNKARREDAEMDAAQAAYMKGRS